MSTLSVGFVGFATLFGQSLIFASGIEYLKGNHKRLLRSGQLGTGLDLSSCEAAADRQEAEPRATAALDGATE